MIFKNRKKIKYSTVNINLKSDTVIKCKSCNNIHNKKEVEANQHICPTCGEYFKMNSLDRINSIVDSGSFVEYFREWKLKDPLNFPEYKKLQSRLKAFTGLDEAIVCGIGKIHGMKVVIAVMDSNFMMGSMGCVVGEKVSKSIELAIKKKLPLIIFTASGGARMQEGMFSLMQMAKTCQAVAKLDKAKQLYISVMTNPTTGGVSASFASLGDIIIAEKGALIGFAGPRVISQVTGTKLPEGFQRAEFLYSHGLVDMVLERRNIREELANILLIHSNLNDKRFASLMNGVHSRFEEIQNISKRKRLK